MASRKLSSTFKSASPADTSALAARFAAAARGGEVISLAGPIGAGKTFFVQSFARALGVKRLPVSASFNLMRPYRGRLNVYHFDLFRVRPGEMENIGLEEYLGDPSGVVMAEWAGPAEGLLGPDRLELELVLAGGDRRSIRAKASGPASAALLKAAAP